MAAERAPDEALRRIEEAARELAESVDDVEAFLAGRQEAIAKREDASPYEFTKLAGTVHSAPSMCQSAPRQAT